MQLIPTRALAPQLALAVLCALTSCQSSRKDWPMVRRHTMNEWTVTSYQDDQVREGVIAQRTIYPHHFAPESAVLNELGERDTAILASHFRTNPGTLNVRRGPEGKELYDARLNSVLEVLSESGVDQGRMVVADGHPAGDGMPSDWAIRIAEQKMDAPLQLEEVESRSSSGVKGTR
jgi:hypothetical protein